MGFRTFTAWRKWRDKWRRSKLIAAETAPLKPSKFINDIHQVEDEDEFLYYFRQYRPKNALPDGWQGVFSSPPPPTSELCQREDSLSRDSGRSSGEITEESLPCSTTAVVDQKPLATWIQSSFFHHTIDEEASVYSQLSSPDVGGRLIEDRDSGVSSISTTADLAQQRLTWVATGSSQSPCYWDASIIPVQHSQPKSDPREKATTWPSLMLVAFVTLSLAALVQDLLSCHVASKAFDVDTLIQTVNGTVLGQDLATNETLRFAAECNAFMSSNGDIVKPISTVVFDGPVGTGKRLLSELLVNAFMYPQNVFHIESLDTFNLENIESNLPHHDHQCGPTLLWIENLEFYPHQVAKLESLLSHATAARSGLQLIVVITTNASAYLIETKTLEWIRKLGKARNHIDYDTVMSWLAQSPDSEKLSKNFGERFLVPFLPLSREQIIQCIWREVILQGGGDFYFTEQEVRWILQQIEFTSDSFPVLSQNGCLSVAEKVESLIAAKLASLWDE